MTHRSKLPIATLAACALFVGGSFVRAGDSPASAPSPAKAPAAAKAPEAPPAASNDHIQVQHILIGFKGSVPRKPITRTQEEAKKLADELLARARKGEDFGALVKQYTDDAFPGIYGMSNNDVAPGPNEVARRGMVPGFGDASFSLKVGEIGVSVFEAQKSPFGWHIVKRIK